LAVTGKLEGEDTDQVVDMSDEDLKKAVQELMKKGGK